MPSSLNLEGDLDDVELIEDVEAAFGFTLSDDELAQCETVGDFFAIVEAKLPHSAEGGCATAMCFYRLRVALQPFAALKLRPSTPIADLGGVSARKVHQVIRQCGLRPPRPYLSIWGCLAIALFVALPIAAVAFELPGWAVAVSPIPSLLLYRFAPLRLPGDLKTFGDLVRLVSSRSIGILAQQGARLGSSEAWSAFTDILSDHSNLPKEAITPDTLLHARRKAVS